MNKRRYFGTDGIRGTVGEEPITAQFALRLGQAVGQVLRTQEDRPLVLIGKDTRISGYMLESALESGLISAGVDVLLLGPVPTPAVAYLVRARRANLGVVISASHNPYEDNGIKFFSASGSKLPDAWEQAVEHMLTQSPRYVRSADLGRAQRMKDASGRYVEFCKATLDKRLDLKGLKLVVDAANGAAYHIAPEVFQELGAQIIKIGCEPDGININVGCGATHPQSMAQAVLQHQADYGIALDGDADRLIIADGTGRIYNGDELLYAMALSRLEQGEHIDGIVGTVMSNMALERALNAAGVTFVRAQVGDRYVLEQLEARGWILGGESSGHLLALDKHSTGDGLVSALQVLQLVRLKGQSLAHILRGLRLHPQIMINIRLLNRSVDWSHIPAYQTARAHVDTLLGQRGRVLVRASGTEPVVRVTVEAEDEGLCQRCAQELAQSLTL